MNLKDTLSISFGKYKNPIFTTSKLKNRMARILTGIQSTGTPHLGNLLGAIIPAIKLSKEKDNESLFFIADLHSLTQIKDAEELRDYIDYKKNPPKKVYSIGYNCARS